MIPWKVTTNTTESVDEVMAKIRLNTDTWSDRLIFSSFQQPEDPANHRKFAGMFSDREKTFSLVQNPYEFSRYGKTFIEGQVFADDPGSRIVIWVRPSFLGIALLLSVSVVTVRIVYDLITTGELTHHVFWIVALWMILFFVSYNLGKMALQEFESILGTGKMRWEKK